MAPGQSFYEAVREAAEVGAKAGVGAEVGAGAKIEVRTVKCLSSCDAGCAAVISMPGKWTYLLGRLDVGLVPDLLAYAATYAAHPTGTVMPSKRPASLARMVLGRVPDLQTERAA